MPQNENKTLSMLGLCRRAGRLTMGFDSTVAAVLKGEGKLVVITRDISSKTEKELRYALSGRTAPILQIPFDQSDMAAAVGKGVRVAGVCDTGFAAQIKKLLERVEDS